MIDVAKAVGKTCPECPFSRSCPPGGLGGSRPETYIGQIHGPFVLACHMHTDFDDPNCFDSSKYHTQPQCQGAAIMRANLGISDMMPPALPRAEPDTKEVFANCTEFVKHHAPNNKDLAVVADDPMFKLGCFRDQMRRQKLGLRP